jgi:pilus assembly protein Flp/PilA
MKVLKRLAHDESGATAIEYGLIVALIALAMVGAAQGLGNQFGTTMDKATTTMAASN